jgi:hypothetical protein
VAIERNPTVERIAFGLAQIILAFGIIGLVFYFTVIPLMDLLAIFVQILLPIFAIMLAFGLIQTGTWYSVKSFITSQDMGERVKTWVKTLKKNPEATPENTAPKETPKETPAVKPVA